MTHIRRSTFAAILLPALLLAACSAAAPASPLPPPSATPPAAVAPIASAPPIGGVPPIASAPGTLPDPGGSTGGGSTGGGSTGGGSTGGGDSAPGNPGDGTVTSPPIVAPGGPIVAPGGLVPDPQPSLVAPTAGLTGIHAVNATRLEPSVIGRDVTVKVAWWSGTAPCSVLAGVDVARDGATFTLTVREGAARQGVACIEIAMYKATIVDLGRLDPGSYTIKAAGDAPAVTVTVAA